MKKYRWLSFYIDSERALLRTQFGKADPNTVSGAVGGVAFKHGLRDLQNKYSRWLGLEPPQLCVPIEWHELLIECESAYIHGDYYPALTSACCLGERILNLFVLKLRDHFKNSQKYKEVAQKESFQNWQKMIDVLSEWGVLKDEIPCKFKTLLDLRNPAVHFGDLEDRRENAYQAVQAIYNITEKLFGHTSGHFFLCRGEYYVKETLLDSPLIIEFIIPHCHLVGYKHRVENINGQLTMIDDKPYDERDLNDENFAKYRDAWMNGNDLAIAP